MQAFSRIEVLRNLSAQKNHCPLRYDGLAKVVIKILFGVSFLGVEWSDACVKRHEIP